MGSKSTMPASVQSLVMCLLLEGDSVIFTSAFGPLVAFTLYQDCVRGSACGEVREGGGRAKGKSLEEKSFYGREIHLKSERKAGQIQTAVYINYPSQCNAQSDDSRGKNWPLSG